METMSFGFLATILLFASGIATAAMPPKSADSPDAASLQYMCEDIPPSNHVDGGVIEGDVVETSIRIKHAGLLAKYGLDP